MAFDGLPNPRDVHSTKGGPGIHPRHVRDVDDTYDLVVVGAGASGLAAAKWYQDRFGPDAKILLIDPLPDFGGHSHRNEFHIPDAGNGGADLMLLRNGGTVNLDSIGSWNKPPAASGRTSPAPTASRRSTCSRSAASTSTRSRARPARASRPPSACARCCCSRARTGARTTLVRNKQGSQTWAEFLATTPYSAKAAEGIARAIEDETTDWISLKHGPKTDQEKKAILARITYKRYLMDYVGLNEEATGWFQRNSHGLFAAGIQATQAGDMWALEEDGFTGLGLNSDIFPGIGRTAEQDIREDGGPTRAWPDGNTSLLRLLVSKLIPSAIGDVNGARPNQETILVAKADYGQLDRARPQRPHPPQQHGRRRPARARAASTASTPRSSTCRPAATAAAASACARSTS